MMVVLKIFFDIQIIINFDFFKNICKSSVINISLNKFLEIVLYENMFNF